MSLASGTRVGAYEILAAIGAGGMGEVYRARDRKLDRDVAIKVLPESLAADPERIARFEREAKTLAALNQLVRRTLDARSARENQEEFFHKLGETSEMLKFEPQRYATSGDHVIALGFWDLKIKATGKIVHSDWAVDFIVKNGKVTRWQAYFDTAATAAAFAAAKQAAV
jgi:ketosteroid isomerase-like protein